MNKETYTPMNILAIDASARGFSVALSHEGEIISRDFDNSQHQAQQILNIVEELIQQKKLSLSDFNCIAFGCGPGSFTGVRLATSIAQTISYVHNIPLIPVSSLQILAQGVFRSSNCEHIFVMTNAHMGEVYCGTYQYHSELKIMMPNQNDFIINPNAIAEKFNKEWVGAGDGWFAYPQELANFLSNNSIRILSEFKQPSAYDLIALAAYYYQNEQYHTAFAADPVYLRDSSAWKKKD